MECNNIISSTFQEQTNEYIQTDLSQFNDSQTIDLISEQHEDSRGEDSVIRKKR
jgi:hypothetical protein